MFIVSRFSAPSRTDTVTSEVQARLDVSGIALGKALDDRTNNPSSPAYFSFSKWDQFHEKGCFEWASAVVLEYSKRSNAEWELIGKAIDDMGLKAFIIDTIKGMAFIFPIEQCDRPGTYTRTLCVLAELIGQTGMVAEPSVTYLVRPKKGATVYETGGEVITPAFLKELSSIPDGGLDKWTVPFVSSNPTRDLLPPKAVCIAEQSVKARVTSAATERTIKVNLDTADAEANRGRLAELSKEVKAEPKSQSDEAFDRIESAVVRLAASVEEFGKAAADLRKQMGGQ